MDFKKLTVKEQLKGSILLQQLYIAEDHLDALFYMNQGETANAIICQLEAAESFKRIQQLKQKLEALQ